MVRSLILNAKNKINDSAYFSISKLPKQDNYAIAYNEAVEDLKKKDIFDIILKSGTSIINKDKAVYIVVPFINEELFVSHPEIKINYPDSDKEIQLWLKILVLHYLINAKGSPASGIQITFKEVTGGLGYYSAFQRRSINPILKAFENNLNDFIITGERIGGIRQQGEFSIYFQVFPRVGISFNIWGPDEEFPADGNVIFDYSISDYLPTEDIALMCNMIAVMMIKNKILQMSLS